MSMTESKSTASASTSWNDICALMTTRGASYAAIFGFDGRLWGASGDASRATARAIQEFEVRSVVCGLSAPDIGSAQEDVSEEAVKYHNAKWEEISRIILPDLAGIVAEYAKPVPMANGCFGGNVFGPSGFILGGTPFLYLRGEKDDFILGKKLSRNVVVQRSARCLVIAFSEHSECSLNPLSCSTGYVVDYLKSQGF